VTGFETVVDALEQQGRLVSDSKARCPGPSHHRDDERPSLSIHEGENGTALLYCHSGCPTSEVVASLGLEWRDLYGNEQNPIVATYYYEDERGIKRWRKHRHALEDKQKFSWESLQYNATTGQSTFLRGTIGRPGLYNLLGVRAAVSSGARLYLVDGEKDANNLIELGFTATTLPHGCSSFKPEYAEPLRGGNIVIIADDDDAGRKGAQKVFEGLQSVASAVEIYLPTAGAKDATDQITNTGRFDPADFRTFELAPVWDDWDEEIPEIDWVVPGVLARGSLVWAYGSKETSKSLYFMGVATALSHRGRHTALYSEEMPLSGDRRRISRFGPDKRYFHWKNGRGLSLDDEEQLLNVIQETRGFDLIVFDSYSKVWRGFGNGNRDAIQCARALSRIINATGACVVMIDHVGFPFLDANGNQIDQNHPRGASAKEQQADMSILFKESGRWAGPGTDFHFTMTNMKPGRLENPFKRPMRITDTEGGGLAVVGDPYIDEVNDGGLRSMDEASGYRAGVGGGEAEGSGVRSEDLGSDDKETEVRDMSPEERRALGRLKDAFK